MSSPRTTLTTDSAVALAAHGSTHSTGLLAAAGLLDLMDAGGLAPDHNSGLLRPIPPRRPLSAADEWVGERLSTEGVWRLKTAFDRACASKLAKLALQDAEAAGGFTTVKRRRWWGGTSEKTVPRKEVVDAIDERVRKVGDGHDPQGLAFAWLLRAAKCGPARDASLPDGDPLIQQLAELVAARKDDESALIFAAAGAATSGATAATIITTS